MAREKTLNFQKILMHAVSDGGQSGEMQLSIYKTGQMLIPRYVNHKLGLDGKAIEFLWEPAKRVLGFKIVGTIPAGEGWTKTMRLLAQRTSGQIPVSVGRITKVLGIDHQDFRNMPIREYQDTMERRTIYYVIIPKSKKKTNEETTN